MYLGVDCHELYTVEQVMIKCIDTSQTRESYVSVNIMRNLLCDVNPDAFIVC